MAKLAMQLEILRPLAEAGGVGETEARALKVMEESVRRQESVIRNFLDLSRLESGELTFRREKLALDGLIAEVVRDYAHATEAHGIEVAVDVPEMTVTSDPDMLWHLFSNLMSNAVKFRSREGGRRVVIRAREEGGEARVAVSDNGVGMTREDVERVFTRFFQASAAFEGSGVGLTICRLIASGLGGWVWLES